MSEVIIRDAQIEDVEALLAIYAPYVKESAITFEYDVPSIDEFKDRVKRISADYPYLVAVMNNQIAGYAYASSFHARAAYQWCAEVSVYLNETAQKKGIGKLLYTELENRLKQQNVKNLNACIAYPNEKSIAFHERMGYKKVGHFHKCGYKLNQWWDMIWMEKIIGEHELNPEVFIKRNHK